MSIETLPCGYLDETDTLIREIELEEMTGYEEDILGDRSKSKSGRSVDEVLARCVKRLGDTVRKDTDVRQRGLTFLPAVKRMRMPDRTFLLIRLRQLSLGDIFAFPITCESCKHHMERVEVDLSSLEVVEMAEPHQVAWDVTLPSGKVASFRELHGEDEAKLRRIVKEKKDSLLSSILSLRVTELDGEKATIPHLKSLTKRDRDFLREKFDSVEGGIDTEIKIGCDECGAEFKTALPVGEESFFFPSGMKV